MLASRFLQPSSITSSVFTPRLATHKRSLCSLQQQFPTSLSNLLFIGSYCHSSRFSAPSSFASWPKSAFQQFCPKVEQCIPSETSPFHPSTLHGDMAILDKENVTVGLLAIGSSQKSAWRSPSYRSTIPTAPWCLSHRCFGPLQTSWRRVYMAERPSVSRELFSGIMSLPGLLNCDPLALL